MQTSNQAITYQKPIKKAQTTAKLRKICKNWKICEKFSQKYVRSKKWYMTPLPHT